MPRALSLALTLLVAVVFAVPAGAQSGPQAVPLFDNLGSHQYGITTSVPLAQRYFDQGLRLYYGFNHAESIRAFEEATRQDPDCAMCYWGIALAYGPNINAPMEREAARTDHGRRRDQVPLREELGHRRRGTAERDARNVKPR